MRSVTNNWQAHRVLNEITDTAMTGIKGIMPAVIILAFAYALNDLSGALNTAD